jgi:hypothetical protein
MRMIRMELELLAIEGIGGFVAGFRHGMTHDRHIIAAAELNNYMENNDEKTEELLKETRRSLYSRIEVRESSVIGGIVGLFNAGVTLNPNMFLGGLLTTATTVYLGLQAGKAYSKFKRDKRTLTIEENVKLNNYLHSMQACHREDDPLYEELETKVITYIGELSHHNPKLAKEAIDRVKKNVGPCNDYRRIMKFLKHSGHSMDTMSIYKDNQKPVRILMMHDKKVYLINPENITERDTFEELSWDGTADKLFNHTQELGNYHNLLMVSGPEHAPMEIKLIAAKIDYELRKMTE